MIKSSKKVFMAALLTVFTFSIMANPFSLQAEASTPQGTVISESDAHSVMPMSDEIRYRYKVINHQLFKRLYNYSMAEWVGPWILCD